jgi:DNA-binding PadR family transcriptional regulator
MKKTKPLSMTSVAVLHAVGEGVGYGFDIMDTTDLPSGTVYPILGRLLKGGLVRSRWEQSSVARREKRPPRRYYEMTRQGKDALADAVRHYQTLGGRLAVGASDAGRGRAKA